MPLRKGFQKSETHARQDDEDARRQVIERFRVLSLRPTTEKGSDCSPSLLLMKVIGNEEGASSLPLCKRFKKSETHARQDDEAAGRQVIERFRVLSFPQRAVQRY